MADVIAIVADVLQYCFLLYCGRCNSHLLLADVIAKLIKQEFGEESVLKLCLWEKTEKKMADYRNHRFSVKCLKREIIPVSNKLKTSIHTRKASEIIRRAEKQVLNECIRLINNMIEINMYKRDSYLHQLEGVLDNETLEDCKNFINRVIECWHSRVLERQKGKFEALLQ